MKKKRKSISKELEAKALNLGSLLIDRKITIDGITGEAILAEILVIRSQIEELFKMERDIRDYKEQLKTRRENLFNTYHNAKSYILSRSRTVPEFKGLISSINISKKRKKKESQQIPPIN
jgi:hypothetical protein